MQFIFAEKGASDLTPEFYEVEEKAYNETIPSEKEVKDRKSIKENNEYRGNYGEG